MVRKIYTEEEVEKRIESLPEAAGDYLYSAEMAQEVKQISDKNHLHIDQMSLLEAEVGELILGLTDTQEFVPNLMDTLRIDKEKAGAVAKDVNDQIISKIRRSMGSPGAPIAPRPAFQPVSQTKPAPAPSVVMPSSPAPKPAAPAPAVKAPVIAPAPMPGSTPPVAKPATAAMPAPKPAPAPDLSAADAMLGAKKMTAPAPAAPAPKTEPIKPQNYKADPYREPVE